jgi:hypothetical protein
MYWQYWKNEMKEIHRMDQQLLDWFTKKKQEETVLIHSIFDKVVNLQSKDNTQFISFTLGTVVQAPNMMQTYEQQEFSWWKESIQVGDVFTVRLQKDSMIQINDSCWSIGEAQLWDGRVWPIPLSYQREYEEQITEFLMENGHERDGGLFTAWLGKDIKTSQAKGCERVYSQAFREGLDRLRDALKKNRKQDILQASKGLLGLGGGLTPSGDDFLVGCFTMWQLFVPSLFSLYQEKDWKEQMKVCTTIISYFMLEQCLNGFVNDAFIQLLKTNRLELFSEIGSTSGIDMLIGAQFALKYREREIKLW